MSQDRIASSLERLIRHFSAHPEKGHVVDQVATAVRDRGLGCRIVGFEQATLNTDIARAFGGCGTAPPPGWLFRGGLAACVATVIAMRAARLAST